MLEVLIVDECHHDSLWFLFTPPMTAVMTTVMAPMFICWQMFSSSISHLKWLLMMTVWWWHVHYYISLTGSACFLWIKALHQFQKLHQYRRKISYGVMEWLQSFLMPFHTFLYLSLMTVMIALMLAHELQMKMPATIDDRCYYNVKLHQCHRKSDEENQWTSVSVQIHF